MSKELVKLFEELKRELKQEFRELRESLERDIRKDIRDIKNSLSFINESYEQMKTSVNRVELENGELRTSVEKLEKERDALRAEVKQHEVRLLQNEQHMRCYNVEVKGVPMKQDEDVMEITNKIANTIEMPLDNGDIEACHRVRTTGNTDAPNIVIQFARRSVRDSFLEKARKQRITSDDIELEPKNPIFINEHLSPSMKKLFGAANAKKKECQWKYAWTRNGKIFVRKTDTSAVISITHLDDLNKVV